MSSNNQAALVEQSFELLIKCMMRSKHRLIELGSDLGLTSMQAMVLLLLDAPRPMYSLTKILNCDASNVTGIIDGLEEKGLAARFPDDNDRRIKMIRLSIEGKALRTKLIGLLVKHQGSVLFKLSYRELQTFNTLLQKITVTN